MDQSHTFCSSGGPSQAKLVCSRDWIFYYAMLWAMCVCYWNSWLFHDFKPSLCCNCQCCVVRITCLCYCSAPVWTTPHRVLSTELGQQIFDAGYCILHWHAVNYNYALLEGEERGVVLSLHIRCSTSRRFNHYATTRILVLLIWPKISTILLSKLQHNQSLSNSTLIIHQTPT